MLFLNELLIHKHKVKRFLKQKQKYPFVIKIIVDIRNLFIFAYFCQKMISIHCGKTSTVHNQTNLVVENKTVLVI
jgi:hypothetical protein